MIIKNIKDLSPDWNETQFTNAIRDAVCFLDGYSLKLGASMFMAKGTPDTDYFLAGVSFLLESKVHPFKVSPIQAEQLSRIRGGTGSAWAATLRNQKIIFDSGNEFIDIYSMLKFCVGEAKRKALAHELRQL